MIKIGLTGGIGSGKSKVTELFAALGVPVIDADVVAKEITAESAVISVIVQHFGRDIIDETGKLNRSRLREIIFADSQQRLWLENLLHPLILQAMQKQVAQLNQHYCLFVAPLLLEATDPREWVDRVLVVDSSKEKQIQRTMSRDHVSKAEVLRILAAQLSREQRLAQADDVITNEGDLAELALQVEKLHAFYMNLKG